MIDIPATTARSAAARSADDAAPKPSEDGGERADGDRSTTTDVQFFQMIDRHPPETNSSPHVETTVPVESSATPKDLRADSAPSSREARSLNNRGVKLAKLGRLDEAIAYYRRALLIRPDFPDVFNNLGISLSKLGKVDEAIGSYEEALRLRPDYPEAHNNLGISLAGGEEIDEALVHFQEALRLKPDYPEANNNLANAFRTRNRLTEAADSYRKAIAAKPEYPDALNNLGNVLTDLAQYDEAVISYQAAIRLNPRYPEAHNNLGNTLARLMQHEEAERSYHRALHYNPDYPEAYNNLGNLLAETCRLAEAVACYREALRLKPGYPEAHNNLGIALGKQGKFAQADACYREALRLRADYADAHLNRALCWLTSGNFEQGWVEYEWRWRTAKAKSRKFTQPTWNGEALDGQSILLYTEQGLGDTIQFIRYAPLLKCRGARVIVECQPALIPLLSNCAGVDQLVAKGERLPAFDVQAPLLSLPRIMRTSLATVPADIPYVYADPRLVAHWRDQMKHAHAFRIGIHWQGNRQYAGDQHRSFSLAHFGGIAKLPGVKLYSLQKNHGVEQIPAFRDDHPLIELGDQLDGDKGAFMDTAAVMMNLDLVITSDTATAHLAGALGVPTWVPLCWSADWRWFDRRLDSPWYPTLRLFRQEEPGEWGELFARMAQEVAKMANRPATRLPFSVPIGAGELIDKMTILEICAEHTSDSQEAGRIRTELAELQATYVRAISPSPEILTLRDRLKAINAGLWDARDTIRKRIDEDDYGDNFPIVARSVRDLTDERSSVKREIDAHFATEG